MANNLRKFNTYSDYEAAELVKPAVSLIVATDEVYFDQKDAPIPPTPSFSGLTVYYNISDISQPTQLFRGGGGSGSGSGSGSGGVLPSAMIIDGTAVEVTATYQFSTTGEHIVNYSFADNKIPEQFLYNDGSSVFQTVKKIEIGDSITSIGDSVFAGCTSLTSATIGSGVTTIGDNAFNQCYSLTSLDIPDSVTTIGQYSFYQCSGATSVTIGNRVTSIGDGAFNSCRNLTSITIPSSVTTIGNSAFWDCTSLTSVNIPSGVTSIDIGAFGGCTSLTSITVNSNNTIYDSRNNCNAIIETATNKLIQGCNTTVIPNSVSSISDGAFNSCRNLTSITIPSSVTTIGNSAFAGCTSLTSVTIPNSVTSIDIGAFGGCTSLTSVNIPSSVTSIGGSVLQGCTSLTSVTVNAVTPPTLGNYAFNKTNDCPIYVPSQSVNAYKSADEWYRYSGRIQAIQ